MPAIRDDVPGEKSNSDGKKKNRAKGVIEVHLYGYGWIEDAVSIIFVAM